MTVLHSHPLTALMLSALLPWASWFLLIGLAIAPVVLIAAVQGGFLWQRDRGSEGSRRRWLQLALLAVLSFTLVSACSGTPVSQTVGGETRTATDAPTVSAECQVITHDRGETKVCGQPRRVVVFGPHMLDILLSLGVQPVGYAGADPVNFRQFDRPQAQIPYLGDRVTSQPANVGTRKNPSLETLFALKPDLILSEDWGQDYYNSLTKIAPTLLFRGSQREEWQRSMQPIAQALGRQEQAQAAIAAYNQKLATARADFAPVIQAHPRMLVLGSGELQDLITVRDGADYVGGLLEELGFQLVFPKTTAPKGDSRISLEVLPQLDADTVIVQAWGDTAPFNTQPLKQEWNRTPLTKSMSATEANRVYFVDYYLWSMIRGPIAADMILDELKQILLSTQST